MDTEQTTENVPVDVPNGGEGKGDESDKISVSKKDYEEMNQTLGSLKRELKDLKKPKEPETPEKTKPEEFGLLQKSYLRAAGITAPDEVELARDIQKKIGLDWDNLVDDDYFLVKLQKLRDAKANDLATSNIRGGGGTQQAKDTPEYWVAKGIPPTREQVPDRKTRVKIARAMIDSTKSGKKFYND